MFILGKDKRIFLVFDKIFLKSSEKSKIIKNKFLFVKIMTIFAVRFEMCLFKIHNLNSHKKNGNSIKFLIVLTLKSHKSGSIKLQDYLG